LPEWALNTKDELKSNIKKKKKRKNKGGNILTARNLTKSPMRNEESFTNMVNNFENDSGS